MAIVAGSPRKIATAIIEPVLTPVTTSNLGRGVALFSPQPSRKPIEKAPHAPPADTERMCCGSAPPGAAPTAPGARPRLAAAWAAILARKFCALTPGSAGAGGGSGAAAAATPDLRAKCRVVSRACSACSSAGVMSG